MRLFNLLILLLIFFRGHAGVVLEGVVKNQDGHSIPKALITTSGSDSIFYTDQEGVFKLELKERPKHIKVAAPGYIPIELEWRTEESPVEITLSPIGQNSDFNAEEIIRRAQIQQPVNLRLYTAYRAIAYRKVECRLQKVPFNLPVVSGGIIPAKQDTGLAYWSERISKLHYVDHYNFDDSTIAFHAAGQISIPPFYDLKDVTFNFYEKNIRIKERRYREYFSPLHSKSFRHYSFEALGVFYDGGRKVFRIGFKPKKSGFAAFRGTMELYDSTFTIRHLQVIASAEQHLKLVDSIKFEQFNHYHRGSYKRAYQKLSYHLDLIGFSANYELNEYFRDFAFHTSDAPLDPLIYHFDSTAVTDDESLWQNARIAKPDSSERHLLKNKSLNPLFREDYSSLTYLHNKFYPLQLFYRRYLRHDENIYINLSPLFYGFGYNTVEGPYFRYSMPVRIFNEQQEWLLKPTLRYGFADNRVKGTMHAAYIFDLLQPKKAILEFGRDYRQFNEGQPVSPLINTFYSLFLSKNYLKLYGVEFLRAGYDHEVINGLELNWRAEYSWRYPLYNNIRYSFTGEADDFTPNNPPLAPAIDSIGFPERRAFTLKLDLIYQTRQQHKVINGRKINTEMKTPTFYLNLRSGIPTQISETNYFFASLGTSFVTQFGSGGYSQWDVNTGGFLYRGEVPFIDYKHFNGEQTFFLQPAGDELNNIKRFSTLRYYDYSTVQPYIEAHLEHNFNGFLLSRIPLTRKLKIHSFTGFNYLHSFEDSQFLEFFIGFDNILSALRLEFAGTLSNFSEFRPVVRVGVDFDYLYYYRNAK